MDDELDGCELDFTEEAISDEEATKLLSDPVPPMTEEEREKWVTTQG